MRGAIEGLVGANLNGERRPRKARWDWAAFRGTRPTATIRLPPHRKIPNQQLDAQSIHHTPNDLAAVGVDLLVARA
jgi:hypothetical protein